MMRVVCCVLYHAMPCRTRPCVMRAPCVVLCAVLRALQYAMLCMCSMGTVLCILCCGPFCEPCAVLCVDCAVF